MTETTKQRVCATTEVGRKEQLFTARYFLRMSDTLFLSFRLDINRQQDAEGVFSGVAPTVCLTV